MMYWLVFFRHLESAMTERGTGSLSIRNGFARGSLLAVLSAFIVISMIIPSVSHAQNKPVSKDPGRVLSREDFFEIENLQDAAREIRKAGREAGVDIYAIPSYEPSRFTPGAGDSLVVKLSPISEKVIFADHSFLWQLRNNERDQENPELLTVILVVNRGLSIDEVASLLESSVRVYFRIGYTFVIQAPRDAVIELSNKEFFHWIDDYKPEYKQGYHCDKSPYDRYTVKCLGEFRSEFASELESLGLVVVSQNPSYKAFGVKGSWDAVQRTLEFLWVKSVRAKWRIETQSMTIPVKTEGE